MTPAQRRALNWFGRQFRGPGPWPAPRKSMCARLLAMGLVEESIGNDTCGTGVRISKAGVDALIAAIAVDQIKRRRRWWRRPKKMRRPRPAPKKMMMMEGIEP